MAAYNFTNIVVPTRVIPGVLSRAVAVFDLADGAPGLVNGDTITAQKIIAPNGVMITDVTVYGNRADTNAAPTGTFNLGDADDANRLISSASLGAPATAPLWMVKSNVEPVAATEGLGYVYYEETDLVLTVNAAIATQATTGLLFLCVDYYTVGIL